MEGVLDSDVDWLRQNNGVGGTLGYAIPGRFEVYGAIDLPDEIAATEDNLLGALAPEPAEELIAGWIDRGAWPAPSGDEHVLYWGWRYRLRRVRALDLQGLPGEGEGSFPDLLFPPGHSWLVSLLWDDSWRSVGASRAVAQRIAYDCRSSNSSAPTQTSPRRAASELNRSRSQSPVSETSPIAAREIERGQTQVSRWLRVRPNGRVFSGGLRGRSVGL